MPALYFGFNFPPSVERHSTETNKDKEQEEQGPDPDLAPLDLVSQELDQDNITDAQPVLFAGWASFVLGKDPLPLPRLPLSKLERAPFLQLLPTYRTKIQTVFCSEPS